MTDAPKVAVVLPDDMPDATAVIQGMREQLATGTDPAYVLENWVKDWPVLELLAPVPVLAEWLGIDKASIYMARTRKRGDGSPVWPAEDDTILGRKMWRFSTVALHRAAAPGRGWNLRRKVREGVR